jgi:hypothetical protein
MNEFSKNNQELEILLEKMVPELLNLPEDIISSRRNSQNRTIRQILGHMVDSASNNTHRIVHLQYQESPMTFPNYASNGNNDKWIAIQNYQTENWFNLVQLWKYSNLHFIHVVSNVDLSKLDNEWISGPDKNISLKEMTYYYLDHFKLHIREIEELINNSPTSS